MKITSSRHLLGVAVCLSLMSLLSACDQVTEKIDQKIEQSLPQVSPEQAQQVDKLYMALQKNDFDWIKQQADASLLANLDKEPNALPYLTKQLPQEAPMGDKRLSNISKSVQTGYGKMLVVTYQYPYLLELVNFSVSFDGSSEGSLKIKGLQVSKEINRQASTASAP